MWKLIFVVAFVLLETVLGFPPDSIQVRVKHDGILCSKADKSKTCAWGVPMGCYIEYDSGEHVFYSNFTVQSSSSFIWYIGDQEDNSGWHEQFYFTPDNIPDDKKYSKTYGLCESKFYFYQEDSLTGPITVYEDD
mmetsp:Transcript_265/g.303  ORF Transcript_265/g.303 Transcript_265/m.303 type:complete len:135 (-) Transcript_265:66-470(-)|eukprot:CAMPEP_0174275612 /NCGR_PEP_ID=MMETSP0439-20130205/59924_1 /TAXON_ID=0 /ORGANISM="Stereomyxa ramosa, Strain Chinc5" /LENGTH=134 /DNA_ID=CAMNT_0015367739 /DNA_START=1632 /DNA_END=2036 /DNA_ORIENTATION=+